MKDSRHIIVLLGGGLTKDPDGAWRTTTYDDQGDNFGVMGDRLRVDAVSELYKAYSEYGLIWVTGGKGQLQNIPDAPTVASVNKQGLITLGVPPERIIIEEKSGSTYEQLLALQRFAGKLAGKEIIILSNDWHLPRVKAFLEYAPGLNALRRFPKLNFAAAEEVLLRTGIKRWQELISRARANSAMQSRLDLENKGIEQIKKGTYHYAK